MCGLQTDMLEGRKNYQIQWFSLLPQVQASVWGCLPQAAWPWPSLHQPVLHDAVMWDPRAAQLSWHKLYPRCPLPWGVTRSGTGKLQEEASGKILHCCHSWSLGYVHVGVHLNVCGIVALSQCLCSVVWGMHMIEWASGKHIELENRKINCMGSHVLCPPEVKNCVHVIDCTLLMLLSKSTPLSCEVQGICASRS